MKQWNKIFKKHGKVFLKPDENAPKIARIFKKYKIGKILDLGCGTGRHVVYFTKNGFDVYGFDISEEGIRIASRWLRGEGLKAHFKIGLIYKKFPYKNNFFDAAISNQAINHGRIYEIRKAIKEIKRVLKPSGLIFITLRKRRIRKYDLKRPIIEKYGKQKVSYKMIAPRTYVPIEGGEKNLPHYLFNKKQIKKEFSDFKIEEIRASSAGRHYCFWGRLKPSKN
ncbi:MAG: class I SAM-dependent methyltransferase [Candidatus Wolfebacteria bacterium]|nr:class I SAM-dependent methyltransferase [Candidatus Wolfebacteria bacterium]